MIAILNMVLSSKNLKQFFIISSFFIEDINKTEKVI